MGRKSGFKMIFTVGGGSVSATSRLGPPFLTLEPFKEKLGFVGGLIDSKIIDRPGEGESRKLISRKEWLTAQNRNRGGD